jgi:ABC-type phosphate/phosphonate transport system substrate-binding protein
VAAIDCVTHALLAKYRPSELAGTRVIHHTELVPAPPYVTAFNALPETLAAMRQAVLSALREPSIKSAKEALMLSDVEILPDDAYTPIESLHVLAQDHDYHEIPGQLFSKI